MMIGSKARAPGSPSTLLKVAETRTILSLGSAAAIPETELVLENRDDGVEAANVVGFMVLQCKNCRTIVGDTSSMQSFNRESFIMTLQKGNANVVIDDELETSKEESDYGSTFSNLYCRNCQEWVGRKYRTTSPELDHLRGNFTLSMGQLVLFEMDIQADEAEIAQPVLSSVSKGSGGSDLEIVKLQKFVLALYDRLERLEHENGVLRRSVAALSTQPSAAAEALSIEDLDRLPRAKPRRPRARRATEEPVVLERSELEQMAIKLTLQTPGSGVHSAEDAAEALCWTVLRSSAAETLVRQIATSS